jgi:hypothetical protein
VLAATFPKIGEDFFVSDTGVRPPPMDFMLADHDNATCRHCALDPDELANLFRERTYASVFIGVSCHFQSAIVVAAAFSLLRPSALHAKSAGGGALLRLADNQCKAMPKTISLMEPRIWKVCFAVRSGLGALGKGRI